jgi:hypothetical protein
MTAEKNRRNVVAGSSIGLGAALAVVMSWTVHKAVGWAIIHGILGWVYVVYYLFAHHDWTWF